MILLNIETLVFACIRLVARIMISVEGSMVEAYPLLGRGRMCMRHCGHMGVLIDSRA